LSTRPGLAGLDWKDGVSGSFGAVCLTYTGLPFDTVKTLAQISHEKISSMKVALNLVKSSGTLSLWRGAGPALASALIDNTVLFTLQRAIQRVIAPGVTTEASLSTVQHAICGGMAGLCSATAICPAELVKCRMQGLGPSAGTSGLSIASGILRVEGTSGLVRGCVPLVVRGVPLQTIFFVSYTVPSA